MWQGLTFPFPSPFAHWPIYLRPSLSPNLALALQEPMTSVEHDQELSPSNGSVDVDIVMSSSAQVRFPPHLLSLLPLPGLRATLAPERLLTFLQVPEDSTMPNPQEISTRRHESSMPHDSFFASYPLLRLSLPTYLAGVPSSLKDSSPPSLPLPDLKPLREATLIKSIDPSKFLCQYEVPGGGVCRDTNCQDVHLSRLDGELSSIEPNGALKTFSLSVGCTHSASWSFRLSFMFSGVVSISRPRHCEVPLQCLRRTLFRPDPCRSTTGTIQQSYCKP